MIPENKKQVRIWFIVVLRWWYCRVPNKSKWKSFGRINFHPDLKEVPKKVYRHDLTINNHKYPRSKEAQVKEVEVTNSRMRPTEMVGIVRYEI